MHVLLGRYADIPQTTKRALRVRQRLVKMQNNKMLSIGSQAGAPVARLGHSNGRSRCYHPVWAATQRGASTPEAPTTPKVAEVLGAPKSNIVAIPKELSAAVRKGTASHDFAGAFQSQPEEYDYWIDEIEGTLPETLRGTLFRNGPGNFERGGQLYAHMLDGDGYICRFAFHDVGRVHFRSRYVRTRELKVEEERGAVMYRTTFGTARPGGPLTNAFDLRLKNPANTNVLLWGGRLFALWEAGAPYELDPETLQTLGNGPASMGGLVIPGIAPSSTGSYVADRMLQLGQAVTAHPHLIAGPDPRLVLWSWQSMLKFMGKADMSIAIMEMDEEWEQVGGASFMMPDAMFNPHDFAVTDNYHVFFQSPTKFYMAPYLLGAKGPAQCVELGSDPMAVWLVPRSKARGAAGNVLKSITEHSFLIHHANGFESDGEVVVWSSGWDPESLTVLKPGAGMLGSWKACVMGDFSDIPFTKLLSHRINLGTGEVKREVLFSSQHMDHPRVNPNFYSRPTRYVYFNLANSEAEGVTAAPQAFARLDTHTGEAQVYAPGPRCFCEELIFVPGPHGDTVEDDGYLLGMVYDREAHRSSLVVMDAADFNKGPLARLHLTHQVPHGLHGQFTPSYFGPQPVWS